LASFEAIVLQQIAERLFRCDVHEQHGEYREHCGACALKGFLSDSALSDGSKPEDGPNYAGWGRVYVEAQRPIPLIWFDAFHDNQVHSENTAYANALNRSLATFGVRFT